MKILVVSANYPSETNKHAFGFVHARVKLYKKYGHRVCVLVPSYDNFGKAINTYEYEGIKIFRVNVNYIREIIKEMDPDVVTYHFPEPKVLAEIFSIKKPLVLWVHGADILITFFHNYHIPFYIKSVFSGLRSIPSDIKRDISLRKLILKDKSIQLVVPSIWMKKMLFRYLTLPSSEHARIYVIPNPVDTKKFRPIKPCYERRRNVGIVVRSLNYKYGVDIAVKAMYGLRGIELIIVGDGPLREYLKGIAEKAKLNVKFIHGGIHHEDLPVYYNEVGFFVAPSRTEAQGVAMCEALACGTPAIATKVGGIPEFVIHGYNGILVRPEPEELQKAIIALSKMSIENYCKMSQNAVQHARTTFSDEIVIPKELKLLSKAIELYNRYGRTY